MVCGIILSGGMSRRFQIPGEAWVDKALFPIDGIPMILRIYKELRKISNHVIIASGSLDRARLYRDVVGEAVFVEDIEGLVGPLSGLLSALYACQSDIAVAVPVDMPYISADLLRHMIRGTQGFDVVSPILPNGLVETAVIAVVRDSVIAVLERLRGLGRARIADLHRGAPKVQLIDIKKQGFDPRIIVNINRRSDIGKTASYPEGPINGDIEIIRGFDIKDLAGGSRDRLRGSLWWTIETGDPYEELRIYLSRGAYMLAAYALQDSNNIFERYIAEALLDFIYRDTSI
ncbi:MAG TPA: molybdenum cofactor guanylyltransferase [Sulfolobales archaeon]|nr:molybdenum cofactor guanylyltransferase [Sulfolobales archaeon]